MKKRSLSSYLCFKYYYKVTSEEILYTLTWVGSFFIVMFCFYAKSHFAASHLLWDPSVSHALVWVPDLCCSLQVRSTRAGLRRLNVTIMTCLSPSELIKVLGLALARYLICFPVNPPLWPPDFPSLKGSGRTSGPMESICLWYSNCWLLKPRLTNFLHQERPKRECDAWALNPAAAPSLYAQEEKAWQMGWPFKVSNPANL